MSQMSVPHDNDEAQAAVIASLEQFEKDTMYLNANLPEWTASYPDQWAIVYCENLVGTARTPDEIIDLVKEKGVPRSRMVVEYLTTEPVTMIL